MKKVVILSVLVALVALAVPVVSASPFGLWQFSDANNLIQATTGRNLVLTGSVTATQGITVDDGATFVETGSYFTIDGIGSSVGVWSLMMDIKVPARTIGQYQSLYQTNTENSDDAEGFVHPSATIGGNTTGYSTNTIVADTWYRVIITWDINTPQYGLYVNGVNWGNTITTPDNLYRYNLEKILHLFADNDGEDPGIYVSNVAFWKYQLSAVNAAALGVAGDPISEIMNKAYGPQPEDGESFLAGGSTEVELSWSAGYYAASHDVYLGTDSDNVNNATKTSPEFMGNQIANNYSSTLSPAMTYFWRIDEVNSVETWKGNVWSFTVEQIPDPVLSWEMDSADDFNLGENIGGLTGRLYVDNKVTGELASGLANTSGIFFDAGKAAVYMNGVHQCKIAGQEDAADIFTNYTQYTFSFWAKADLNAVVGNGSAFHLFWSDGSKFKNDLSYKADRAATLVGPGCAWQNWAYHIWDPAPAYAYLYVDPQTWNMYTFTWNADDNYIATYVNGIRRASYTGPSGDVPDIAAGATVTAFGFGDGNGWNGPGGWYRGFKIWNQALEPEVITALVGDYFDDFYDKARLPSPYNSENLTVQTTPFDLELSWRAGTYADSHDLYIGTNFDAVNDADNASDEFVGNIAGNNYDITLDAGKTYYWRVDEVNDIDIWKGEVWSFKVAAVPHINDPVAWYSFDETSGATVEDSSGNGFNTAAGGTPVWDTDGAIQGCLSNDVAWSVQWVPVPADVFADVDQQITISCWVQRTGMEIDGSGPAGSAVGSLFCGTNTANTEVASVRFDYWSSTSDWHLWYKAGSNTAKWWNSYNGILQDEWTHLTVVFDAVDKTKKLYANGQLATSYATETSDSVANISAFNIFNRKSYVTGLGWWDSFSGKMDDFRIYDRALSATEVGLLVGDYFKKAARPNPANKAENVGLDVTALTWTAGKNAVAHQVYFGDDSIEVGNADTNSSCYHGEQTTTTFEHGAFDLGKTYYWRIDEVDSEDAIWTGDVWSFSSISYIMVEDFESYDTEGNDLTAVWTERIIGDGDVQFTLIDENYTEPVLGPVKSMRLKCRALYEPYYAVAKRSFSPAQDWTVFGVKMLVINYYGDVANFGLPVFVTVGDGTTNATIAIPDADIKVAAWQELNVSLPEVAAAGVDLTNVSYLEIGFGDGTYKDMAWDTIYIDNIALYPSKCVVSRSTLLSDATGDCVVNYDDLVYITDGWLRGSSVDAITAANPVGLWLFDDPANLTKATIGANLTTGVYGGTGSPLAAVAGMTAGDGAVLVPLNRYLVVDPNITPAPGETNINEYTMVWDVSIPEASAYGTERWVALCEFDTANLATDADISVIYDWASVDYDKGLFGTHQGWSAPLITPDTWYQLAVSVDNGNFFNCYVNGELVLSSTAQAVDGRYSIVDKFHLFKDDDQEDPDINCSTFALFDRALTSAEIKSLVPVQLFKGDLNDDASVDFADYSTLAGEWLVEDLWP